VNCQDRTDSIHLYAAGALPDAEAMELREHLATGCPACQAELAAASAVASMLPLSLDPLNPPADLKQRLMQRIDDQIAQDEKSAGPINANAPMTEPWGMRIFRIFVPAAVAAGITLICTHYYMNAKVIEARNTAIAYQDRATKAGAIAAQYAARLDAAEQKLQSQSHTVDMLTAQSTDANAQLADTRKQIDGLKQLYPDEAPVMAMLASDKVRVVDLKPTDLQKGAVAHLVWDEQHRKWAVLVAGMKPAAAGETYELWFVTTAGAKIRAGIFDVDQAGGAAVMINLPPDLGPLKLVAVTNEKAGGVEVPAGQFQMIGNL
jgi:anti-sigma factor RsiW